MRINYLIFFALLYSCNSNNKTIFIDGFEVVGEFKHDTIPHGQTYWYLEGVLRKSIVYDKGFAHGRYLIYNQEGMIQEKGNYYFNFKNGYNYKYYDTGEDYFISFYYFGKKIGPEIIYNEEGELEYYLFSDFQQKRVFLTTYTKNQIDSVRGSYINSVPYLPHEQDCHGLFLFLINPPMIKVDYKLAKFDKKNNKREILVEFENYRVFIDTLLPKLENENYYEIIAETYDSTTNKSQVHLQELYFIE